MEVVTLKVLFQIAVKRKMTWQCYGHMIQL